MPLLLSLARAAVLWGLAAAAWAGGAAPAPDWKSAGGRVFQHTVAPTLESADAMVQDAAGFLWLGTQSALVRWDGHRERDYFADPTVAGALPDAFVKALLVDRAGTLWVGTNAGGVARYQPASDSFAPVADPQGVVGPEVAALAERAPGGLWIAGTRGLAWLDPASGRLTPERLPADVGPVRSLLLARDGAFWLGSDRGLWRRAPGGAEFAPVPLEPGSAEAAGVPQLLEDRAGRIWVGTHLHGVFVVEPGSTAARQWTDAGDDDLSHDTVHALVDAGNGELWIGTYGGGVVRIDMASGRLVRERHEPARPSSLLDDAVGAMMRDREGVVWVCTGYGLSRYDTRFDGVATFPGGPGQLVHGTSLPAVMAMPDGRTWMSAGEQGLQIVQPGGGASTLLMPDPRRPETTLPRARVIAFAGAPDGTVWIGTQGGLYRAAADGGALRRVVIPGRGATAETWALQVDGATLWMGGKDGLWALDTSRPGQVAVVRHVDRALGQAHVTALALGARGELWIGSNGGVFRLDGPRAQPQALRSDPRDPEALPRGLVSALLVDPAGRLWVACFGQGVQVEVGRGPDGQPRFRRLTVRDGLPHNGVDALLRDADGQVWASTDDGLARIDPATLAVRALRSAQGVGITVFWTGAATIAPDGDLLFGGEGGLVVVHPRRLQRTVAALPPPVVTEASIGGRPVPWATLAAAEAVVPAQARRLQVEFASLAYGEQDALRYAYRLEGFDGDWVEASPSSRLAAYTNLPPGRYRLALRVARASGDWSAPREIALRVEPRWFERADVRAGGALLLAAALLGLVQLRTAVLRRRQIRLEALVDERTAELSRRTDELRRSQRQLEQLAYFDALTGLANRRLFADELRRLVADAARGGEGFALALIDLDHFKQVNDTFGHDAGDAVLVATGRRLGEAIRASDRAARLGGDEFAILMRARADDPAQLDAACRRITERLGAPVASPAGDSLQVGSSIGIARFPRDADSADALYKAADAALYAAKRAGRGQWRWAAPPPSAGALEPGGSPAPAPTH
jgi:diguanylate cyclase (GGDEF)-like protein